MPEEPKAFACPDPGIAASLQRIEDSLESGGRRMDRMTQTIEALKDHVELTNGRVAALEVIEAVRAGVEKANAKLMASAIAIGALIISGTIGVLQLAR